MPEFGDGGLLDLPDALLGQAQRSGNLLVSGGGVLLVFHTRTAERPVE